MSRRFNAYETLQLLGEESFFSQADIAIQPPGDGLEYEEDSGEELMLIISVENNCWLMLIFALIMVMVLH